MMLTIFINFYILACIAGLLFPPLYFLWRKKWDSLLTDETKYDVDNFHEIYSSAPLVWKFIVAIIPVLNFIWVVAVFFICKSLLRLAFISFRGKFLIWLAALPMRFLPGLRRKLVKKLWPEYYDFYLTAITCTHAGEIAKNLVDFLVLLVKDTEIEKEQTSDNNGSGPETETKG